MTADDLAAVIGDMIARTLQPLSARLAVLEERSLGGAVVGETIAGVRERLAVLETRAPVPGPAGPAGLDGKDGADGLGVDELLVESDGERTITIKAAHGERVRTVGTLELPVLIYRQVWTPGTPYTRGDVVTLEGAGWHCHKATDRARPGTADGAPYWQLMVKRGDRGKDAR